MTQVICPNDHFVEEKCIPLFVGRDEWKGGWMDSNNLYMWRSV